MKVKYNEIELCLYTSLEQYTSEEATELFFEDAHGNEVEVDLAELGSPMAREHFTGDENSKPANLYWVAITEFNQIIVVIVDKIESVEWKELLFCVGHEYGHLIDAADFKNSTESYNTDEGYRQEETKAIAFENFVKDVYQMTVMIAELFKQVGVVIS